MSRIFGPVMQNGYVVRNLDEAVKHWAEVLGVGPFFVSPPLTFETYRYKGALSKPELRIALANSGSLQIELIEQVNDAPSFYKDFLAESGPGLQHLSVWSTSYDEDTARFVKLGLKTIQDGVIGGGLRFAYYDTSLHGGCAMEVFDAQPPFLDGAKMIREAAANWDGKDSVRYLGQA